MKTRSLPILRPLVLACLLFAALSADGAQAGAPPQPSFTTADQAVAALVDAVRQGDTRRIEAILGPGSKPLVESGDKIADTASRERFVAAFDAQHNLAGDSSGRMELTVGTSGWTMPIPLVRGGDRWHFDSRTGAQKILDRRIGRNEIAAIAVMLDYVRGQKAFFEYSRAASPPGSYAQHLLSSPSAHDGLYWPTQAGEPESPLGVLVAQALAEGYPVDKAGRGPLSYHGYYFRILNRQGADAPGGALDYVEQGAMRKGFALVGWPASYGASGIMTFLVNQDGIVFQKDLGVHTTSQVGKMTSFNPDLSWAQIDITGD